MVLTVLRPDPLIARFTTKRFNGGYPARLPASRLGGIACAGLRPNTRAWYSAMSLPRARRHYGHTGPPVQRGVSLHRFVRVPVDAILHWPRADLLTYVALAALPGRPVTIKEIRELARIRKQELLRSLKDLMLRDEVQRTREPEGRFSYRVAPPGGRWARVPVTVLQDQELRKADVLVYIALASYASRWKRVAWPTGETLAERAGVSVRTVYGSLAKLRRNHISCLYSETGRRRYVVPKKSKLTRVRIEVRREDELTSMWRAAMRSESPPAIPEHYIEEIEEEVSGVVTPTAAENDARATEGTEVPVCLQTIRTIGPANAGGTRRTAPATERASSGISGLGAEAFNPLLSIAAARHD